MAGAVTVGARDRDTVRHARRLPDQRLDLRQFHTVPAQFDLPARCVRGSGGTPSASAGDQVARPVHAARPPRAVDADELLLREPGLPRGRLAQAVAADQTVRRAPRPRGARRPGAPRSAGRRRPCRWGCRSRVRRSPAVISCTIAKTVLSTGPYPLTRVMEGVGGQERAHVPRGEALRRRRRRRRRPPKQPGSSSTNMLKREAVSHRTFTRWAAVSSRRTAGSR